MIRMLLRGLELYGLKEIPGEENNPVIMSFFKAMGKTWVQGDETAWCSAFINYLAIVCGYEYSGELTAKSWLHIGYSINRPVPGCLVIYWRDTPSSWKGHVGLWIREENKNIYTLGSNQDNMINIIPYPDFRLLDYRMLRLRNEAV